MLQVGRHVNPGAFSTDYDINKILLAAGVLTAVGVDAASDSSYFKFNLDYISFYNLVRLESSSEKSIYLAAFQVLRNATDGDQNAMFDLIDHALSGPSPSRDSEALALINAVAAKAEPRQYGEPERCGPGLQWPGLQADPCGAAAAR